MAALLRKNTLAGTGSSTSLTGPKFGATLDLLRLLSSNLFKLEAMLKVHDETDIDLKQSLVEALDSVRKVRALRSLLLALEALTGVHQSPECHHFVESVLTFWLIVDCRPH